MKKAFILITSVLISGTVFAQQDTLVYHSRRAVVLEGSSNFRDLGGYPTPDGRQVQWGRIYRSADISKLSDQDLKTLESIHLAVDCDLRSPEEVQKAPDRLPTGVQYVHLPAGSEHVQMAKFYEAMKNSTQKDTLLLQTYRSTDHLKAKYKPLFDHLLTLKGDQSLLFHCTAGKDRTGIGAALVLSALNVDRQTILKDYQATNQFWKVDRERMLQGMAQQGLNPEAARSMLDANPAYLENTFQAIDKKYGSMDQFLEKEMGLTAPRRKALQDKFLK